MMDFWTRLDQIGKCGDCCPLEGYYCAPYVGPYYESSKPRILFVGLDHGEKKSFSAIERRDKVIDWWEQHAFRDHYKGCIWVASKLLQARCRLNCQNGCLKRTDPDSYCALRCFSQTNAVRCVNDHQDDMTFRNHSMVPVCIPLVFNDIRLLRPQVIILQGSKLQRPFLRQAKKQGATFDNRLEYSGSAVADLMWEDQEIIVAALRHPSHGWLKRDWEGIIIPILGVITDRLGKSDCRGDQ